VKSTVEENRSVRPDEPSIHGSGHLKPKDPRELNSQGDIYLEQLLETAWQVLTTSPYPLKVKDVLLCGANATTNCLFRTASRRLK